MLQEFLLNTIGYILIWIACDINRNENSKITIFTTYWWIQLVLIMVGAVISTYKI